MLPGWWPSAKTNRRARATLLFSSRLEPSARQATGVPGVPRYLSKDLPKSQRSSSKQNRTASTTRYAQSKNLTALHTFAVSGKQPATRLATVVAGRGVSDPGCLAHRAHRARPVLITLGVFGSLMPGLDARSTAAHCKSLLLVSDLSDAVSPPRVQLGFRLTFALIVSL